MRFLPIGPRSLLVELPDLAAALALFDALTLAALPEVAELIPAAQTLLVRCHPGTHADAALAARIRALPPAPPRRERSAPAVEIPVTYDGADLAEVAGLMGLDVAGVIAAHQAARWTVAFCGFAPGFAYLTCDDPRFDLPRRASPRPRIPAGSVALAGQFGGVYPQASPGGWQLIGTTTLPMWDPDRDPPALLAPGQEVRFVARAHMTTAGTSPRPAPQAAQKGLHVLSAAFPLLVQDAGRSGQAHLGVARSGALDLPALRAANARLGNAPDLPALEITLGPTRLTVDEPATLALAGAADAVWIETATQRLTVDHARPFALDPGEVLAIAAPAAGMRSYLALRGGFDVPRVLGSAATDTLAGFGPPALTAGSVLPFAHTPARAVDPFSAQNTTLPRPGELITLPVTLGPRTDWFPADQVASFLAQDWLVTDQMSRSGLRLQGTALTRAPRELPSEGTDPGAIQIPHSGQPVLFLADHPLTGGYPVIATLLPDALALAGQIPPGARIRFAAARPFEVIA
ncbi:urea amidolyase family protein [Gemmobacter denitrificans]|uniref:Urea amidolyase family protein n=1 Tax=Gemmobacter denitrificans TaxID=3123040 RepID=A0ABU8BT57_9RHOB